MQTISIFLSSSHDCASERDAVHDIVARLNADPIVASFATIQVHAWDWAGGVPFDALRPPQASVDRHIPPPEACDIYLGIARCRFGTPLHESAFRRDDGRPYGSGTEYEFDRAWRARRRGAASPEVLMYRWNGAQQGRCPDDEQTARSAAFFTGLPFSDGGGWSGAFNGFADTDDFRGRLEEHLRRLLSQWRPGARQPLQAWIASHARALLADAGPRYTAQAHVESALPMRFAWLLARPQAVALFDRVLRAVWDDIESIDAFTTERSAIAELAQGLRANPAWTPVPDFAGFAAVLRRIEAIAHQALKNYVEGDRDDGYRRHVLRQIIENTRTCVAMLSRDGELARKRVMLLTGPAGQGKTHTLVDQVCRTVAEGGLAVGVLCQTLSEKDDLRSALQAKWRYEGTFDNFLDQLEQAGAQRGERVLIVIDALNETPGRQRWTRELSGILQDILDRPHLALALSVRDDYLKMVLPAANGATSPLWQELRHPGFAGVSSDALLNYCRHYGVRFPVTPPTAEMANPLYLRLLVKSLQGRQDLSHWLPSWLEVWERWIDELDREALAMVGFDSPREQPVRRTLRRLAQTMLESGRFELPRYEAEELAKRHGGSGALIGFLCSAGALLDQVREDEEFIQYGFERLSDTFLVDRMLAHLFGGVPAQERRAVLQAALSTGGPLGALMREEGRDAAPGDSAEVRFLIERRAGLLKAMCLAVPAQAGVELSELIPPVSFEDLPFSSVTWDVDQAVVDSLRWRCKPEEFGLSGDALWRMWERHSASLNDEERLDELIRLALIPDHPFAIERHLHPCLLAFGTPGERDAAWSIPLVGLWENEDSCLQVTMRWATESSLDGIDPHLGLAAARLMAWLTTVPQRAMRRKAMQGLTRILVACPQCLDPILADFLAVNDPYVLEAVLLAVLAVVIHSAEPTHAAPAARQVYDKLFRGGCPPCHLTVRHYGRRLVEHAVAKGWLAEIDTTLLQPPYRSSLPLDDLPSIDQMRGQDDSSGFARIVGSCTSGDFYWYVMGGTSGPKPFLATPLHHSSEPARPWEQTRSGRTAADALFDIPLAARFVVWNCRQLGWTSERFDAFDGYHGRDATRFSAAGRTERIGKKYQWIGWLTILGFLTDHYQLVPEWDEPAPSYDEPQQISYIEVLDPSRFLRNGNASVTRASDPAFWAVPSLPAWPAPNETALRDWGDSKAADLSPLDVICAVPSLPASWGEGPWLRIAAHHVWRTDFAPGTFVLGQDFRADIWWQIVPGLVRREQLSALISALQTPDMSSRLPTGRISNPQKYHQSLTEWNTLPDEEESDDRTLPFEWTALIGENGDPDANDEHGVTALPRPRLFREWGLEVDARNAVVLYGGEVVFGLAGLAFGEDALFARVEPLRALLDQHGYALVWRFAGERRAAVHSGDVGTGPQGPWIDYHGVGYLGEDGGVHMACLVREPFGA